VFDFLSTFVTGTKLLKIATVDDGSFSQKSGKFTHRLKSTIIYKFLAPSQVVIARFLNHQPLSPRDIP